LLSRRPRTYIAKYRAPAGGASEIDRLQTRFRARPHHGAVSA
jgi:hypothetical protein